MSHIPKLCNISMNSKSLYWLSITNKQRQILRSNTIITAAQRHNISHRDFWRKDRELNIALGQLSHNAINRSAPGKTISGDRSSWPIFSPSTILI